MTVSDPLSSLPTWVTPSVPPAELELSFYRHFNPDLATLGDADLRIHFERHGKAEGRIASPAANREGLLAIIEPGASILEIGPFTDPVMSGPNVRYFDVMDREALIARAATYNRPSHKTPVIDYVSPDADLGIVRDRFDYVVSSHCIEHQPNLVRHLNQVESVLAEGGRYLIIIPDKRYTFDVPLPTSLPDEVIIAHMECRARHTLADVIDHHAYTTHHQTDLHWRGDHEDRRDPAMREVRRAEAIRLYKEAAGAYVDVHAWKLTPDAFRTIIEDLHAAGLTRLAVERVYQTQRDALEFTAVLRLT